MKGIVITEKNYRQVAGRLKKFFAHKNFIVWHTFNGGMRSRFNCKIYFPHIINTKREYYNVSILDTIDGLPIIKFNELESFYVSYGDEILFLGSRIVIKSYGGYSGNMYIYETFQIISE